jgi:CNT family concentrative nucleoside transporter
MPAASAVQSLFGFAVFVGIAWLLSESRSRFPLRIVLAGAGLQFVLAAALLYLPGLKDAFVALNDVLGAIEHATQAGTAFVFGYLGGGPLPFAEPYPGAAFVLGLRALPIVLVMSALSALLFHWKVLPVVVRAFSWLLERSLGIGGALGLGGAANIFVGMVEAPLLVRPYLRQMSRSEFFALMTTGMATIAGTVLVLYAVVLKDVISDSLGKILIASVISVPAAVMIAMVMIPSTGAGVAGALVEPDPPRSAIDAITRGTAQGVQLLISIAAMLIVFVSLVSLANQILAVLPAWGGSPVTLQRMSGYLLAPFAWLAGIPWSECATAGHLLGTKVILNELIAYLDLAKLPADMLEPRSRLIMTYAMCGFANLGSLGIMIGGLSTMVPERRAEIVSLGLRSIVSGMLATLMTGAVIGVLWHPSLER